MGIRKIKDAKDLDTGEKIYLKGHAQATYMSDGSTVEDTINQVVGGDTEKLVVTVSGISEGYTIYVMDENDNVIDSQTTSFKTYRIPAGTKYYVKGSEIRGYYIPSTELKTAHAYTSNEVNMKYESGMTTIRINQNISDPYAMITRIVDEGGIERIRANSHRYTGTFANNVMTLKQLDDNDGTKYLDGTSATLTTIGTDVWMKLPQFWWKCEEHTTDIWDFSVCTAGSPDNTWKEWDGNTLIGVYEGDYEYKYLTSSFEYFGYSISDTQISTTTFMNIRDDITNTRGEGFKLSGWEEHCMMAMLYFMYYGNTNSVATVGRGIILDNDNLLTTGATNSLGMQDTIGGIYGTGDYRVNFWGLEDWWGGNNEVLPICHYNAMNGDANFSYGEETINNPVNYVGYISKMIFGENINLSPSEAAASFSTGFCAYSHGFSPYASVLCRGNTSITSLRSGHHDNSEYASVKYSFRLAFHGDIVIES